MEVKQNLDFVKQLEKYKNSYVSDLSITNKSKLTISSYLNTINSFLNFLSQYDEILSFETLRRTDIVQFLEYKENTLEKQGELSPNTKKLLIIHLKMFFKYIEQNSRESYDFDSIFRINIKIPKAEPKGLSKDEQIRLINHIEQKKLDDNVFAYRNALIIKTLLFAGLRRAEIISLSLKDYVEEDNIYILNFFGKGEKQREVYIQKELIEEELEFLQSHGFKMVCTTSTGNVMDGSHLYRMLKVVYNSINIKSDVHTLRHTFAKNQLGSGIDITIVQELLGHSSLQTTSIYTSPKRAKIKEIYKIGVEF